MQANDHIVGGFFGMAVGDALGQAVKGLKPETVRQCFGGMDVFQDVRPFIGKGVKQYRMQGLYGIPTQTALAVLDGALAGKNADPTRIAPILTKLSAGGPESGFGVYRHAEGGFRKAVDAILNRPSLTASEAHLGGGACLSIPIPLALRPGTKSDVLIGQCIDCCLLLTQDRWEVLGAGVWGALLAESLQIVPETKTAEEAARELLQRAAETVVRVEESLRARAAVLPEPPTVRESDILAETFSNLASRSHQDWPSLCKWIAENASAHLKTPVSNPAQGTVLTLLPLAMTAVLKSEAGFPDAIGRAVSLGKESGKLGALVGSLAGALHGFAAIPQSFKSGLVNAKEIRVRAEALAAGRPDRSAKDLYAMELAFTQKECEEGKRFVPKKAKKTGSFRPAAALPYLDDDPDEPAIPKKEDTAEWRRFQKDKTRKKRDRRRHLDPNPDWE